MVKVRGPLSRGLSKHIRSEFFRTKVCFQCPRREKRAQVGNTTSCGTQRTKGLCLWGDLCVSDQTQFCRIEHRTVPELFQRLAVLDCIKNDNYN